MRTWLALVLLAAGAACSDDPTGTDTTGTGSTSTVATSTTGSDSGATMAEASSGGEQPGTDSSSDDGSSTGASACTDPVEAVSGELVLTTPTGDLHGSYLGPAGCPPFPTVLFHVGSGPTDRDGNTVGASGSNDGHLQLAQALAEEGIASVRYDKRGVAQSTPALEDPSDLLVQTYVDDLAGWVEMLRGQSDTVAAIIVLGHSEGSLYATLVAASGEVDGLVHAAGPGRPFGDVLAEQLMNNVGDPDLLAQALQILEMLEAGQTVDDVPVSLLSLFDPSIQPFLITLLAYDPTVEIANVAVPTTILAGDADIQIPASDAELLAAAKPDAELRIIAGMTHTFKSDAAGQAAAYDDPTVPLADGVVQAVVDAVAAAE